MSLFLWLGCIGLLILLAYLWANRRYSLPCPASLAWMVELDNPFTQTNRSRFIIKQLALTPGMSVLDAGCGPGRLTIPVAEQLGHQGRVLAVDIQQEMLDKVRKKALDKRITTIDYLNAPLGKGALPFETFDRALLITVLGEIPDQKAALQEIYTALKPGGILSITEIIFDPHFQRLGKVEALAQEIGFKRHAMFGGRLAYNLLLKK